MTDKLLLGIIMHLIADWFLQNDWMAKEKHVLNPMKSMAAYMHGMIHFLAQLFVFDIGTAAILAIVHMLIDTRKPLQLWRKWLRQTTEGDIALHVAIWEDQVLHIACIALATYFTSVL